MDRGLRCISCRALNPEPSTLLCGHCHCRLHPADRWRIERDAISTALIYQSLVEQPMGMLRWTPQQYAEYLQRRGQQPEDKKARSRATPKPPNALVFEIPLTPMGNVWLRMHHHARATAVKKIADSLALQIPMASGIPFRAAKVDIVRYSSSKPDKDGLYGSVKGTLDALQLRSKKHPFGIGVIVDDDPDHIDLNVDWAKAPPNKGKVVITITQKA